MGSWASAYPYGPPGSEGFNKAEQRSIGLEAARKSLQAAYSAHLAELESYAITPSSLTDTQVVLEQLLEQGVEPYTDKQNVIETLKAYNEKIQSVQNALSKSFYDDINFLTYEYPDQTFLDTFKQLSPFLTELSHDTLFDAFIQTINQTSDFEAHETLLTKKTSIDAALRHDSHNGDMSAVTKWLVAKGKLDFEAHQDTISQIQEKYPDYLKDIISLAFHDKTITSIPKDVLATMLSKPSFAHAINEWAISYATDLHLGDGKTEKTQTHNYNGMFEIADAILRNKVIKTSWHDDLQEIFSSYGLTDNPIGVYELIKDLENTVISNYEDIYQRKIFRRDNAVTEGYDSIELRDREGSANSSLGKDGYDDVKLIDVAIPKSFSSSLRQIVGAGIILSPKDKGRSTLIELALFDLNIPSTITKQHDAYVGKTCEQEPHSFLISNYSHAASMAGYRGELYTSSTEGYEILQNGDVIIIGENATRVVRQALGMEVNHDKEPNPVISEKLLNVASQSIAAAELEKTGIKHT